MDLGPDESSSCSGDWRRDRAGWVRTKHAAEARFGPADILVNNAGIGPDGHELADMTLESFDRTISINLTAVFNGVHVFVNDMKARRSGYIVIEVNWDHVCHLRLICYPAWDRDPSNFAS